LLISNKFKQQKLDYIHNNPVAAGLVDEPEFYKYSSASDYAGQKGLLKIKLLV
jgi:putative transposase